MLTKSEKNKKIASIKSEVRDLHPLLQELLPKRPDIIQCDYTHGPNEKGADFVLHKHDAPLGRTIYVGVVVKRGKLHQDLDDVLRQVDECKMPRHVEGGTKKIFLSEIWVITTENITSGAQEKIHFKFPASNIAFIDGSRLADFVDEHLPSYWLNISAIKGGYLSELRDSVESIEQQTALVPYSKEDVYLEPSIVRCTPLNELQPNENPFKPVKISDDIENKAISLIFGQMGAGKSKLLRRMVKSQAEDAMLGRSDAIPVYVDAKTFFDHQQGNIKKLLEESVPEALEKESGCRIIYIDGMDEAQLPKDTTADDVFDSLANQLDSLEDVQLVISSRPNSLTVKAADDCGSVSRYELQPLTTSQLVKFVQIACKNMTVPGRLIQQIASSDLIRQLPQTPIAALLLSKLIAENRADVPGNLTELYAQSLELMLGRWDMDKGLSTQKEYEASEKVCMHLAKYVLENGIERFSEGEAIQRAEEYLSERNLGLDSNKLVSRVLDRSGIFAKDQGTKTVYFKHRSFAEFLLAKRHLQRQVEVPCEQAFDPYWGTTCFFYVGLLKDCENYLHALLSMPVRNERDRWIKVVQMPNYLLAAITTPYGTVSKNLPALISECARLHSDISAGKASKVFQVLSQGQLLWFMQSVAIEVFAYDYFKSALEDSLLLIDEDITLCSDEKAHALFFAASALNELGNDSGLKFIVSNKELGSLPILISTAIERLTKNNNSVSTDVKKRNKKLRQTIRSNKGLQEEIRSLWKNPIGSIALENRRK